MSHTSLHSSPCAANTLHSHLSAIPFIPLFCSLSLSRGTSRWVLIATPGHAVCFHLPQGLSHSLHATVQTHQLCVWRETEILGKTVVMRGCSTPCIIFQGPAVVERCPRAELEEPPCPGGPAPPCEHPCPTTMQYFQ